MIVEAEQFILKDSNGKRQATLNAAETGPTLRLYDPGGNMRIVLAVGPNGPVLAFFNEDGTMRASLGAFAETVVLQLHDEVGRPRAVMDLTGGETSFSHLNEDGMQRAGFRSSDEGGGLNFYDAALNTRLSVGLREDGEPILVLVDAHGNSVFLPYDPK